MRACHTRTLDMEIARERQSIEVTYMLGAGSIYLGSCTPVDMPVCNLMEQPMKS